MIDKFYNKKEINLISYLVSFFLASIFGIAILSVILNNSDETKQNAEILDDIVLEDNTGQLWHIRHNFGNSFFIDRIK